MTDKLIILTLSFLCAFAMQANDGKAPIVIKGSVISKDSGEKIKGAIITIEKDGQVVKSITTDESGKFCLKYESPTANQEKLKVKIYKKGFSSENIRPLREGECELKVELKKKPKFRPFILPAGPQRVYDI